MNYTLSELKAKEERALAIWTSSAAAEQPVQERYESPEYKAYMRAVRAVNQAVIDEQRRPRR